MLEILKYNQALEEAFKEMVYEFYETGAYVKTTDERIEKTINCYLEYPDRGEIHILKYDQNLAGYGIFNHYWSNEYCGDIIMLDELYIRKSFRKKGIGAAYMTYLSEMEAIAIQAEALKANKKAAAFYKSQGFDTYDYGSTFYKVLKPHQPNDI